MAPMWQICQLETLINFGGKGRSRYLCAGFQSQTRQLSSKEVGKWLGWI